jgi:hypothetical protein
MAPNGVIGGMPAGGPGRGASSIGLGQPGAGRAGARINPGGGVIGAGGGTGGGTAGPRRGAVGGMSTAEHPANAGMYGQGAAGRRSGRRDETEGANWDPDNPWETAEGVDPVVLPAPVQRVDPGPAIGLG